MASIRSQNTKPERVVRSELHNSGYRYRTHVRTLPGSPDIVFTKRRAAVFVHGCFWHLHEGCRSARIPKKRLEYWVPKLERNVERDVRNRVALQNLGWRIHVVWECELQQPGWREKLVSFLGPAKCND
jgi:DNA mismatch endonuclease (patch repair protein)